LLFDYPNFGASESRVAQEVDPWLQVQSYRDAISYATSLTFIDDNRVGLWGGSYSGGHAIVVAALDSRVKCFVTMTPFISGSAISAHLPTPIRDNYIFQFNTDRGKRMQGAGPMMIPVVSKGNSVFCAIRSTSAWNFVENFRPYAPAFQNGVTLKSIEMEFEYEPGSYIEQAGNKPKLFLLATADELMPETQILDIYNKAYEPKELKYIEGNHFSPYMEKLDAACDLAIQFFKKYLSRS
jgi:acetyl esterase/lipase